MTMSVEGFEGMWVIRVLQVFDGKYSHFLCL